MNYSFMSGKKSDMKLFMSLYTLLGLFVSLAAFAEESPIQYTFSGATAEENKVTLQGAGFGSYPQASVAFGSIPADNAFDGATDGQGAIITAQPGEGVMIFGQKITTPNVAIVRCSIRTDRPHASVIIATIGDEPDLFVSQNTPANKGYFTGQYLRLQTFCTPPSTGFQPVIQIINTSSTESLTAYLDNFEIYLLSPAKYYNTEFLDGDESDPPADKICVPSDSESGIIDNDLSTAEPDLTIPLTADLTVAIAMARIPSGTFTMGSPDTEADRYSSEGPRHVVSISEFYMGMYEITQAQWRTIMISNASPSFFVGENLPVEQVSWNDCQEFIAELNKLNLDSGTFRLPTEAEWEYACRAGTTTKYYWGDEVDRDYAWYSDNSDSVTHEVGTRFHNPWKLFDMCGNVWELCQDWYSESYYQDMYTEEVLFNPTGPDITNPSDSDKRVDRGGGMSYGSKYLRSAYRGRYSPTGVSKSTGFRIVLVRS
jgi:formylglycine-generating enzyme required for sulfatase activity